MIFVSFIRVFPFIHRIVHYNEIEMESRKKPLFLHTKLSKPCRGVANVSKDRSTKKENISQEYLKSFPNRMETDIKKLKLLTLTQLKNQYPDYDNLENLIDQKVMHFVR